MYMHVLHGKYVLRKIYAVYLIKPVSAMKHQRFYLSSMSHPDTGRLLEASCVIIIASDRV